MKYVYCMQNNTNDPNDPNDGFSNLIAQFEHVDDSINDQFRVAFGNSELFIAIHKVYNK